jgi:ribonuclease E
MTRKRVGQGLIEAFSTICDSCGGRGIHIHAEPVKKIALEKNGERHFSKTIKADADKDLRDDEGKASDDELEDELIANSNEVGQEVEIPAMAAGRRKGRRAVSTGVISTN